jgi:hypothetical protein
MRIENLKRWHWCIIGAGVGAAAAAISLFIGPQEEPKTDTVAPHVFEAQILDRKDPTTRLRVGGIRDVVIHPPNEMPLPGELKGVTEYVTYHVLLRRPQTPTICDPAPRRMLMQLQTPKQKSIVGNLDGLGVREYLDKLNEAIAKLDKDKHPDVQSFTYKFAWIETPKGAYSAYSLGGFVVIGLIWPTIVQLLVGAGFGRGPSEDDEYNLARYKGSSTTSGKAKVAVSVAQADQLAQLEAELEARLKSGALAEPGDTPARAAPAAAPIPVLSAGPLEAPKESQKQAQRKGYGADQGDYYPTEVHGKKKS